MNPTVLLYACCVVHCAFLVLRIEFKWFHKGTYNVYKLLPKSLNFGFLKRKSRTLECIIVCSTCIEIHPIYSMYYNLHLAYLIFFKKLLIWDSEIYINSNYFLSYKALEFRWSFRASVESFSTETYGGVGVKKVYLNKVPNYVHYHPMYTL